MGLLQKVFDANAALVEKIDDFAANRNSALACDAAGLAALPFIAVCEASALAAKIRKKPLDTSKTYLSGKFF